MRVAAGVVALALGLAGCGGGDDEDERPGLAELIAYLPADDPVLMAVDVDAARAELELPGDADATDVKTAFADGFDASQPEQRLVSAVGAALPPVDDYFVSLEEPELLRAIDGSRLHAAASNTLRNELAVTAIATEQSFDEIADALADSYSRDGDTLTATDGAADFAEITAAGGGVVLLTGSEVSGAELGADPPGGPLNVAELLDGDAGSAVVASSPGDPAGACLLASATNERADGTSGTLSLLIEGEAKATSVDTEALAGGETELEPGEPALEGDVVRIPYTAAPSETGISPGRAIFEQLLVPSVYECND